jgi:type VI secretion system protein VasD
VAISIVASGKINPSGSGRPSPVVVRLYDLKTPTAFANADFISLFEQDKTVLADDLIARDEFTMQPGEKKIINKVLSPQTRVIGLVAAFRDIERAQWRGIATVAPGKDNSLSIELDDVSVRIIMKSAMQ